MTPRRSMTSANRLFWTTARAYFGVAALWIGFNL